MAKPAPKNEKKLRSGPTDAQIAGEGTYAAATSRPLYALVFLLPLIFIYEYGILTVDAIVKSQSRIVAFTWLQGVAEMIGMDQSLAWAFPGFVVIIILVCWHLASEFSWRINPRWVMGMYLECIAWSLPLFAFNLLLGSSRHYAGNAVTARIDTFLAQVVTSIGAGIYEELVFRLILMALILLLLEDVLKVKPIVANHVAIWVSAVLFAAHHYAGFQSGHWIILEYHTLKTFMLSFFFRLVSGAYFAYFFRFRGYGIIAGTHAAYNIILYSTIG